MKDRRTLLIVVPRLVSYVGFLRERVAKRLFDLFLAAAALLILAPMLAALALAVRLAIGTPILFKQQRPGLRGRPFAIYKFRTMSSARDAAGGLLPDAERLGWFGKFLRSTSLDELPELINVLRGEMSIVGPRPLLMEYLPRYSAEQMRRHDVLPGITGLAQITGRNKASWPRKFELDVWYVDHRSMWLDLKIIAATLWKVLQRDGINLSHRLSAEPFMGNAEAAQSSALMIERKPTTVLVIGGENTVGQPLIKAARPMALPCRIVDIDCDKLPVEKSEAQVIQMHGRRSSGAVQTLRTSITWRWILQSDVYEEPCSEKTYRELSRQKQLSDSERGLRAISPSFSPPYRCPSEPDTVPAALRAPAPAMAPPDEIQDLKMDKPVLPRIHLSPPHMSGEELEFVKQAFASNWIAPLGPHVDAFEAEMAEYIGVSHAAALVSGTAGIHLALRVLDIQPGDEVLCSTLTFSATANPVLYEHARPVFIDCGAASWNIDPALLREELDACARRGRLPRAVIIVDLYGEPADYHEIEKSCSHYEVPTIEDAAEALGATYGGRRAGAHGQIGVLSFNGNKIITTSGGGMLVSDNEELIKRAHFLAAQARDPAPHYQHSCLGFNYRMSNVLAAVGRAQLRVLPERIAARRRNLEFYFQRLAAVPGIEFMPRQTHGSGNNWLTCITIDPSKFGATREEVRLMLEAHNIEARPVWKPLHMQPVFAGCRARGGERSAAVFERGLCLPSGSNLSQADLERISTLILAARKSVAATAL